MAIGSVKFFNTPKGFGFIIPDVGGDDIFVDKASVRLAGMSDLEKGQRLSYEIGQDAKGALKAVKLETVGPTISNAMAENSTADHAPNRAHPHVLRGAASRGSRPANRQVYKGQPHRSSKVVAESVEWRRNYERYCNLALRTGDDPVAREGYLQHAEHFYRMMNGSDT